MGSVAAYAGLAPTDRAELEWLLDSGALGRSANLVKVLRYICEETAAGRADQIKEYSIAVEALGRKPDFDPQTDTIVRVTVHTLRKRLQEVYDLGEGVTHPIRIVIPPGGYGAQFVHTPEPPRVFQDRSLLGPHPLESPLDDASSPVAESDTIPVIAAPPNRLAPHAAADAAPTAGRSSLWLAAILVLAAIAAAVWGIAHHKSAHPAAGPTITAPPVAINGPTRILLGDARHPFNDLSGDTWTPQSNCKGGESLPSTGAVITGTEDPYLYDGGLRGIVRCTFHAPPGFYEIHVYFAEPSNLQPAERVVNLTVNDVQYHSVDVVDRAGADHAATMFTLPGISPETDGTIHLDFTSEVSPMNAIEILPAPTAQPLPMRIIAASASYKDDAGKVWLSDRYFRGGRHEHLPDRDHGPNLGLYASGRIGSFQYVLPAQAGTKYRITLYFHEAFFTGGAGSRVFDVYCNGQSSLHNFDILAEGHGAIVTRTIEHVVPSPQGLINLQFAQDVNYPLVNAIEVTPE